MDIIHVLQLIAAVTVFVVGLYIKENERIIFELRDRMDKSLNDIEMKCNCNPEVKSHDAGKTSGHDTTIKELVNKINTLEKNYIEVINDLGNHSHLVKEQQKQIIELQKKQKHLTEDLKDKDAWISEQKLKSFIGESGRDLVVIIDSSGSIGEERFKQSLKDVATLVGLLCPKPDPFDRRNKHYNQIAVIAFSTDSREIFDFRKYQNLQDIQQAIISITYDKGYTCTDEALDMAKQMFTSDKGMRSSSNTKKEVLLLTDGEYNCGKKEEVLLSKANSLKSVADVYGMLIGMESVYQQDQLSKLVSGSNKKGVFTVGNYKELSKLVSKLKLDVDIGVLQCAQ